MSPNEERIATIRDTLEQSFPQAALSARLGGRALVILEDVDKLCIVETELVRKIRETVIQQGTVTEDDDEERDVSSNCPETADGTQPENSSGSWMDVFGSIEAVPVANATPPHTFNPDIDFADLTNITESYMPRDLVLFVERAKYVALAHLIAHSSEDGNKMSVLLTREHFEEAQKGSTLFALRNMSLGT
ncbi:Peroxisome biosynthesis protein pex1 [Fusarium odoratissimum]|nr:uncharacterized protein FOIG_01880 [Fusarium odoratissimum NRRL 54006]EXM08831.1 hypothetical protein FOIG_01880 [Fusarium odoratissimum NRRL 54006]KAK2127961.1 hypothetical protein NOF04DRAFT_8335 [Fusarium oxysporum II5]